MNSIEDKLNMFLDNNLDSQDLPPDQKEELLSLYKLAGELKGVSKRENLTLAKSRTIVNMAKEVDRQSVSRKSAIRFSRLFASGYMKAASVAMIALLTFTVSAKSVHSDPDSILYPLKLVSEKVSYILSINRAGKAELRIKFSDERLKEFESKYKNSGLVDQKLINAFLYEAQLAINDIQRVDEKTKESLSERFTRLNGRQLDLLKKVEVEVDPKRRSSIRESINMCEGMRGMRGMMMHKRRYMRRRMMR